MSYLGLSLLGRLGFTVAAACLKDPRGKGRAIFRREGEVG